MQVNPGATPRFVHFGLGVNSWRGALPDVGAARPARCPACEAPASVDGRIDLHGHGLRTRVLRGPLEPGAEPDEIVLIVRRYQCQRCKAVTTVGPSGLTSRRYSTPMIMLALWLWAVCMSVDAIVRAAICPLPVVGLCRPERWTTLRRWAKALALGSAASGETLRDVAHREALLCHAQGPPDATQEVRVFVGAALAHRGPSPLA